MNKMAKWHKRRILKMSSQKISECMGDLIRVLFRGLKPTKAEIINEQRIKNNNQIAKVNE